MDNLLEIKNLTKLFVTSENEKVLALENLSLNISKNKLNIFIGKTGCGKTTLLNIIAGLDKNYKGEITSNTTNLNISYVFQHYTLFPWRNILDNIAFNLEIQGIKKSIRLQKSAELATKVGLAGFEKSYPYELSGGMRQRVAIAQSLAKSPDLLLLDEPFGALDDETRQNLQQMLLNLIETEKMTVIMVTHNITEALLLGDNIFEFSARPGKIVKQYEGTKSLHGSKGCSMLK